MPPTSEQFNDLATDARRRAVVYDELGLRDLATELRDIASMWASMAQDAPNLAHTTAEQTIAAGKESVLRRMRTALEA